ncbi:MAG: hypothetical protein OXH99_14150 [Bryobacterales bacterium]|nr:hypothetical protein [Bryobacterales bacterium]
MEFDLASDQLFSIQFVGAQVKRNIAEIPERECQRVQPNDARVDDEAELPLEFELSLLPEHGLIARNPPVEIERIVVADWPPPDQPVPPRFGRAGHPRAELVHIPNDNRFWAQLQATFRNPDLAAEFFDPRRGVPEVFYWLGACCMEADNVQVIQPI